MIVRKLCKGGSGFYGNEDKDGFCSKCWRSMTEAVSQAEEILQMDDEQDESATAAAILQTNLTRCWTCKRRIGLLGFECRCKYKFCGKHRYPEKHACTVDHRKRERKRLREENAVLENQKIQKI